MAASTRTSAKRSTKRAEPSTYERPLSFIRHTISARGRWVKANWFDVPDEPLADGHLTGLRAAAELMAALKNDDASRVSCREVMKAAYAALEEEPHVSRRGAAMGFLSIVEHFLGVAAKSLPHEAYIGGRVQEVAGYPSLLLQARTHAKRDFARRMEITKAAKALAARVVRDIAAQ